MASFSSLTSANSQRVRGWLLLLPLLLIWLLFWIFSGGHQLPWLLLLGVWVIFILSFTLGYFLYQGHLSRLQQQLQQLRELGDATNELLSLPDSCDSQQSFVNALLIKAIALVEGAEMGSVIVIQGADRKLQFAAVYGQDLKKLQQLNMQLHQTFQYRLTGGRCDRVVTINDTDATGDPVPLQMYGGKRIRATLSCPIHIDGKLYGLLNLDSQETDGFSEYDASVISILAKEAANAISLYQKNQQIQQLTYYDQLTGLANRSYFEQQAAQWALRQQPHSYLVLMDVDNLKLINDQQGYDQGDEVLRQLALVLQHCWPAKALMARLSGDKFAVLSYGEQPQLSEWLQAVRNELTLRLQQVQFTAAMVVFNGNIAESLELAGKTIDNLRH